MPFIPAIGDVLLARHFCVNVDQVGINSFYYVVTNISGGGVTDQAIVNNIDVNVAPVYKSWLGNGAEFYGTQLNLVHPGIVPVTVGSTANAGPGVAGVGVLPGQVSGLISAATANRGNSQRCRAYIPFGWVGFNDATDNIPNAAATAQLRAIALETYTNYSVALGGAETDLAPVIFHRATNSYSLITSLKVRDAWATQLRRGNYGRKNTVPPF